MLKEETNESGTWGQVSCDTCRSVSYLCTTCVQTTITETEDEDNDEVASWLLLNPEDINNQSNSFLFGVEYSDQCSQYHRSFGGDGVVPLDVEESISHHLQQNHHNFQLDLNYDCSLEAHYNYNESLKNQNNNVLVSSMDISVVPESTTSYITEQISSPLNQMVQQLTPMDREARVLRYREKKKTRKFEKTIRYASRKAYAEIRPRIKGRFAKRIEVEADAGQLFDSGYGIVPSF